MPTIYIDDKPYEVRDGQNLLHAIISLGIDLPYFCWHPALGSVGACRQCAVIQYKDEDDKTGKLAMACMVPVQDGLRCSVKAPDAAKFRENVIEWLMVNHPHDCPVCDEGGECHLQDMTVMSGHNYRRYKHTKRTFKNQDLGPFIYHEMNRCITCYRCVRFYHDFAGGDDLQAFGAHDHIYFGRYEDGTLESEFSGNLVEVCPTGVFTDKTLRHHYTRKWDLQSGPSVCQHCSLGCNTLAGERYGKIVRILNRYNHEVNGYFICDRGRFGYEFVNSDKRIRQIRTGRETDRSMSTDQSLEEIASVIADSKRTIAIGSPRASLESNFAVRALVGENDFFQGITRSQSAIRETILKTMKSGPARAASLHDVEQADAVLILGEDLTNTAPMLALAVRQAVRNQPMKKADKLKIDRWQDAAVRELLQDELGPMCQATVSSTKLDKIATAALKMPPQDIARFGFAVAHAIDNSAPRVDGLDEQTRKLAEEAAAALTNAEHPVIIAGESAGESAVIRAASNCASALRKVSDKGEIAFVLPECNSLGLAMIGGGDIDDALAAVESGDVDTLVLAEIDLYRLVDKSRIDTALEKVKRVILIDHLETAIAQKADIILPAATFADGDGTIVNNEGRAQRFFQALNPSDDVRETWKWVAGIMAASQRQGAKKFATLDGAAQAVFDFLGDKHHLADVAPKSSFRIHEKKVARSPHRYSGRTAMAAHIDVHESRPPDDGDSPLSFSMEGMHDNQPGSLIPFFWSPGWNSVQATQHYMKEVGAELRGGDPGVRLIESTKDVETRYHSDIPEAFSRPSGQYLAVPLHDIFGSEELSNASDPIQQRIRKPYAAMNESAIDECGCKPEDTITITFDSGDVTVEIVRDNAVPDGVIGIVTGHDELPALQMPALVSIAKDKAE